MNLHQRIRQDLLYRLRWNVLDAAEDIEIATGPYDQTVNMLFFGHPLADKPLFDPPLSCIDEVIIRDFSDKRGRDIYYQEEERYQPPAALRIDNQDGSPITLRHFVTEVHNYVGRNLEEIKRVKGEMYGEPVAHADGTQGKVITFGRPVRLPDSIGIFFDRVMSVNRDGTVRLLLMLHAEGEFSWPKGFWTSRLLRVRNHEARR